MIEKEKIDEERKYRELEFKLNRLEAEEVVVNRICKEVGDRLERRFSDRNLFALIVLIATNIGGWGIFLPQAEQNIKNDVQHEIEQQVEDEVQQEVTDQNN